MMHFPEEHASAGELATIELSRCVDHLLSLAPWLSAADLEDVREQHKRLHDLLLDQQESRARELVSVLRRA